MTDEKGVCGGIILLFPSFNSTQPFFNAMSKVLRKHRVVAVKFDLTQFDEGWVDLQIDEEKRRAIHG